jgi:hypothetical protein
LNKFVDNPEGCGYRQVAKKSGDLAVTTKALSVPSPVSLLTIINLIYSIMEDLLRKLGLIVDHQMELPVEKARFVSILRENVDSGGGVFEAFSSNKNVFKGFVDLSGFELKKRRKLFGRRHNLTKATGTFSQLGDTLRVDTRINGFHWSMIIFYTFLIIFYVFFLGAFFLTDAFSGSDMPPFLPIFFLLHAAIMIAIPYFLMKSGVRQMQHELEREFFYLLQKDGTTV